MPQMAPLWWEFLFLMFIMSFTLMSMLIYHLPTINVKSTKISTMKFNQLNWKW